MKYLKLHKLIWFIIVLIFTLFEIIIICTYVFFYFVWNLKIPKHVWSEEHTREDPVDNHFDGSIYSDHNIIDTIKRRYKMFNKNN